MSTIQIEQGQQTISFAKQSKHPEVSKNLTNQIINSSLPDLPFLNNGHTTKAKLLILLFSNFSPKSKELLSLISPECQRFYRFICIDDERIKSSIQNKISRVPSIIIMYSDGLISIYEGEASVNIVKNMHMYQLSTHLPNCQCPVHKQQSQQQSKIHVLSLP